MEEYSEELVSTDFKISRRKQFKILSFWKLVDKFDNRFNFVIYVDYGQPSRT